MARESNDKNDNQVDRNQSSFGGKPRKEMTGKMSIHEQHEVKKPKAGGPTRPDAHGRKGC